VAFLTRTAVLALAAVLAHLAFAGGIAAALYWGYPHRIYDVRNWPNDKEIGALVTAFLHTRPSDVVFVGSSFTFGYPWQEPVIFSRLVGRGTNVSVVGTDLNEVHNIILCNFGEHRPRAIVLEIPVINAIATPRSFLGCRVEKPATYFEFAVRRPLGVGWLPFVWDKEAYPKPDDDIKISAVSDDYFRTTYDREKFAKEIVTVLQKAKGLAPQVYAFPSPVYLPGVTQVGRDAAAVREQLDFSLATCRTVPGVVCLDTAGFYDKRDYYYNMTHLNQRGHRAMADFLAPQLR
jgi:hypothetical protein